MENLRILAAATTQQDQSEVSAEPATEAEQAIVAVDPNSAGQMAPARRPSSPYTQLIFIVAIFAVMYFILFREPRRKQKQHQKMVQSLKKNDKVRTIGGIFGTVVDIKGEEVILKVDESNNTKIRVAVSAIGKNLVIEGK